MTTGRVADLLAGRTPDHLPWVPELNDGFCRKALAAGQPTDGPNAPNSRGKVLPYRELSARTARLIGSDHLSRVVSVRTVRHHVSIQTDPAHGRTVIHTPEGDLTNRTEPAPDSGTTFFLEHFVKGPESFAAYRAMVEDETYEPVYDRAAQEMAPNGLSAPKPAERTPACLPTIDVPATPLMHLLMWEMGVEPTLMGILDYRDEMVELMAVMHEKNKQYYRLAAAGPGQILRPMEDTSALLTGPRLYAEHCVGMLNDYADIAHAAGKLFVPHMCGHLDGMLDVLSEVRLDGIEAVTPPPTGNADLARIRRRLGDIWIWGGVDPTRYATDTVEEITRHVQRTLDAMRGDRKFMLGSEEIPISAKLENVKAVAALVAGTAEGFYA